jgi:hypothetical protein
MQSLYAILPKYPLVFADLRYSTSSTKVLLVEYLIG